VVDAELVEEPVLELELDAELELDVEPALEVVDAELVEEPVLVLEPEPLPPPPDEPVELLEVVPYEVSKITVTLLSSRRSLPHADPIVSCSAATDPLLSTSWKTNVQSPLESGAYSCAAPQTCVSPCPPCWSGNNSLSAMGR
jgi:hypothetical protein